MNKQGPTNRIPYHKTTGRKKMFLQPNLSEKLKEHLESNRDGEAREINFFLQ